ncbi:hypothetical protein GCM10007966_12010 [Legionella impletisoli]|uniref:DUF1841 domain-containing protein n=3 Tax=Bacteria TaxID=2 RepID=A0A917JWE6_9GAMM|nr:hypothetical protein GCM10007966_12010 [Legionella impletisoli]
MFFTSWKKYRNQESLSSVEKQVVAVILDHPEYHTLLEQSSLESEHVFYPELGQTNPFLHMGLHLAVRDQVTTDRPNGIRSIFQTLVQKHHDPLCVEHKMMDCFAETLWLAERHQCMPDVSHYLSLCKRLLATSLF